MKQNLKLKEGRFLEYYQEGTSFTGYLSSSSGHWLSVKGTVKGRSFTIQYQVFKEEKEIVVNADLKEGMK
jgi:hypothetical protein